MPMTITANPGSRAAIALGCKCPVIDNGHGKGYMGGAIGKDGNVQFVVNETCVLHGFPSVISDIPAPVPDADFHTTIPLFRET